MRGNPLTGAKYFFQGVTMLTRPELKKYVLGPLLLNLVLVAGLIFYGTYAIQDMLGWASQYLWDWIFWLLYPFLVLTVVIFVLYSFSTVLQILASPFNGLLSEKVEVTETGEKIPEESIASIVARTLGREMRKLMYFLPRFLFLLLLSIVVPIFAPLLFLFGCWMFALQYLDYALDNHGKDFATLHLALKKEPLTTLGFGAVVSIGFMIPVLNLLVMPAAVCGATMYWCERLREEFIQS